MKFLLFILSFLILTSCFPVKIAPNIEGDKVMVAKKFKRKLPKKYSFIFEDPKNANEFYQYVNTKFRQNDTDVGWNIPFIVNNKEYYFSFYEAERSTKTINIAPMIIDAALEENDVDIIDDSHYTSRVGKWYLILTVSDNDFNDCLKTDYKNREDILKYLRKLKSEYLTTSDYNSLLFKKNQF